jgi:benzoyl-CoA reductase subunit B
VSAIPTQHSRKDLACTADATAYQRRYGSMLKEQVIERGEPFVVAQADTPHELFHAMDIPLVTNQWWAAYISAKQLSNRYFAVLEQAGYPSNSCHYCSLGLACSLANDPASPPWGGLPKPTVLVARLTCDCIQQVFGQWARLYDTEFFPMEAPGWIHKDPQWFEHSFNSWESVYEAKRIELLVEEMRELIALLERKTGRRFEEAKLEALMHAINEQEGYIDEAARLIGSARPCPVSIAEQMPNTMIPQWHRGSPWAIAHARRFRDEVAERVKAGIGTTEHERVRLMWIGAGLWHDPGFYNALEERFGAVFVWSMYTPFAGPQYLREVQGRPLHALASRICSMNEVLHLPPWMNSWMVSEAKRCGIDAAVVLLPPGNRLSQSGTLLTGLALESAGVPTLTLAADMVNAKDWSREQTVERVGDFLRQSGLT